MKLPRKVIICGKVYTVRRNPSKSDGWGRGDTRKRIIQVGSKRGDRDPQTTFDTFVHEITELVMLENSTRFNRDTNDDFFYQISHHDLDRITTDIATALRPMINE